MESTQSSCDEHETLISCPSEGEKIEAFVQDSLEAHEEFLQSQREPVQLADEQKLCQELDEAGQPGEGLTIETQEGDDYSPKEMQKNIEGDVDGEERPESSDIEAEESVSATELSEDGRLRDEPDTWVDAKKKPTEPGRETEERESRERGDWKQPGPRPPMAPSDPDDTVALTTTSTGPGPLVTDLEEVEPLETIHLQPLFLADLPDLEDVDTEDEDVTGHHSPLLAFQEDARPMIQIVSGDDDDDDDDEKQHQCEAFEATSGPALLLSDHNILVDYKKDGAMGDQGAEDDATPVICESLEGSIPNQNAKGPPTLLIEELD